MDLKTAYEIEEALKVVSVESQRKQEANAEISLQNPIDTWKIVDVEVNPEPAAKRP